MRLEAIAVGRDPPREVNVIVEVPVQGAPIKYEMDETAGALVVDRFLYTAMRYPGNYGFIPHTRSEDGDPCDVLVANERGIIPGAVLAVRPVGVPWNVSPSTALAGRRPQSTTGSMSRIGIRPITRSPYPLAIHKRAPPLGNRPSPTMVRRRLAWHPMMTARESDQTIHRPRDASAAAGAAA